MNRVKSPFQTRNIRTSPPKVRLRDTRHGSGKGHRSLGDAVKTCEKRMEIHGDPWGCLSNHTVDGRTPYKLYDNGI